MRAHKEIRLQTLALVAAVTGVIGVLMFSLLTRGGSLVPRPSLLAGVLLVAMGGIVLWLARPVRRYLEGEAKGTLDPLRAARVVVLAQAAALTGAAAAGWWPTGVGCCRSRRWWWLLWPWRAPVWSPNAGAASTRRMPVRETPRPRPPPRSRDAPATFPARTPVAWGWEPRGWAMSKNEKKQPPAEQDPDEDLTVNPPQASPVPPDHEPPLRPDGYGSGV